jgi:hypothetical protein
MQAKLANLVAAHRNLMRCAKRFSRDGVNADDLLLEFRAAQVIVEDLLADPEISAAISKAIAEMIGLSANDDLSEFLNEFLTNEYFEDEVKLSCFQGMKKSEIEGVLHSIKKHSKHNKLTMSQLTPEIIRENFSESCDQFVNMISLSRALDKRNKIRLKNAAKKAIQVMSVGGISAAVNAALAIPTAAILPTISLGITAGAAILSTQYVVDARGE